MFFFVNSGCLRHPTSIKPYHSEVPPYQYLLETTNGVRETNTEYKKNKSN